MNLDKSIEISSTDIVKKIQNLDPQSIEQASQATYAKTLFSPLVQLNEEGGYESVLADNFYWENNNLIFEVSGKVKTWKGRAIVAKDVYHSLSRTLNITRPTHGSLKQFLDSEDNKDYSKCFYQEKNKVVLKIKKQYKSFILQLLSNTESLIFLSEYANSKKLPKETFEESTGPYYVSKWLENGIELSANKFHTLYHKDMPQKVNFIDIPDHGSLKEIFEKSKNMIIPGYVAVNVNTFLDDKLKDKVNIFQTQDIKLQYLTFTKAAQKKHSPRRRLLFTKKLGEIYLGYSGDKPNLKKYSFLFSQKRHGSLTDEQREIILKNEKEVEKDLASETGKGFTLSVPSAGYKDFFESKLSKGLPDLKIILEEDKEYGKSGDFGWYFRDMSFTEDYSLINQFLENLAGKNESERNTWIDKFVSLEDKTQRNALVQDIHFQTLADSITIPFAIEPYFILSKKPWVMKKSNLFADTPIWKLRLE